MTDLTPQDQKEVVKQAIKEWLDEQYTAIGRYTVKSLLVAAIGSFLVWYISVRGYKFP